ncbi:carboxymuconolactone decarboxylase family protein [Zobellella maritima]|uniref:carboxymuconolactone decarboxylase family protein n=1 Tax=Zobellella maritima TaxID=2059725 RepID=UPI000E3003C9|nr:carboxymuconolactone decarboxylase family protein [Zobellella maritima]
MNSKPSPQYLKFKQLYPDLFSALEAMGKAAKQAGPLDEKQTQLVQLAGAAASHSEGAVHSHTRRALDAGATVEEICHALILLTSTIGFPSVMAALSWAQDVMEGRIPPVEHTDSP